MSQDKPIPKSKKCRQCKVKMEYQWADDGCEGIHEWLECPECGKTTEIPKN